MTLRASKYTNQKRYATYTWTLKELNELTLYFIIQIVHTEWK